MAGDTLGIGISGLLTAKRALTTVGHNISNAATEGYSRQRVDQETRVPERLGDFFVGTGVQVSDISRLYDEFVVNRLRTVTSSHSELSTFNGIVVQVDDVLGDPSVGLAPTLQSFFNALQDVADDPAATTARQVLLSEADTLTTRFGVLEQRLSELYGDANTQIRNLVEEINGAANSIAELNRSITSQNAGESANDLLDKRDQLIQQLAERVHVSTVAQDNGAVNVFIGTGQALVVDDTAMQLGTASNSFDPSRIEVTSISGATTVAISDQITGGALGGVLDARKRILDETRNALGQLAIGMSSTFNVQHRLGMDLTGTLGGDFFAVPGANVLAQGLNTGTGSVTAAIVDAANLTASDYQLTYDGANNYTLRRLADGQTNTIDTGGVPAFTTTTIDGFTLTINSGAAVGDAFLIQPTATAARDIGVAITDPARVAAAVPVRTAAALGNSGTATVDPGRMTDPAAYVAGTYTVVLAAGTAGAADGATVGVITDDTAFPAIDNALRYQLRINGTVVYAQNEGDPLLADLAALAAVINDDTAATGVRAYVDTVNNQLLLANEPSTSVPITVAEELVDANSPALPLDAGDNVTGYFGAALTGAASTSTQSYGAAADRYAVFDSANATITGGAYASGGAIAFNGIETTITGAANSGDIFSVSHNTSGVSDNRNALALVALQTAPLLAGQTTAYKDLYGQLVVDVGSSARQAKVNLDAQAALLDQAKGAREAVSGVNLDEEAADLVRFQQAYQASAQVIATANSLFQTLIDAVRR